MRSSSRTSSSSVLEIGAGDAVAADADDDAHAVAEHVEDFGGDREAHAAALREDGDFAGIKDAGIVAADGADLDPIDRVDDADRCRPDDADAMLPGGLDDPRRILPRQALGEDVHQLDLAGGDRFDGGVLGPFARNGDEASVDLGVLLDRLGDGVVNGHSVNVQPALAGRDAGDDVRAVVEHLHRHSPALFARDALDDDARIFADERFH